jgi:hypothetical protein
MITTLLRAFTHGRQARLLSLSGLLVQCAPRQPHLAGTSEKFFRMLKADGVGVVDVKDVVDGHSN